MQENFTLQFSDTAFDFKVVSKDGCMSSVSWAMTLHNVLLEGNSKALMHLVFTVLYKQMVKMKTSSSL